PQPPEPQAQPPPEPQPPDIGVGTRAVIKAVPARTESLAVSSPKHSGRHKSNGNARSSTTWMKRFPLSWLCRQPDSKTRAAKRAPGVGAAAPFPALMISAPSD